MTHELKTLSGDPEADLATTKDAAFAQNWKNIASSFLKVGLTYGQMWGVMQTELQEKQRWVSKERFVEALSLVNMLPGAPGPQLAIILGHARGGMWSGLLAGLCLVLPAFFILLVLTIAYASLGVTPIGRGLWRRTCCPGHLRGGGVSPWKIYCVLHPSNHNSPRGSSRIDLKFPGDCRDPVARGRRGAPALPFQKDWHGCSCLVNGFAHHTAVYVNHPYSGASRTLALPKHRRHWRVLFQSWRADLRWRLVHGRVYSRARS
jgi:hypothetical protein